MPDYLAKDIADLTPAEMLEMARQLERDAELVREHVKRLRGGKRVEWPPLEVAARN